MTGFVLISGATGGLGKAFAAECANRGWDVFLTDIAARPLDSLAEGLGRQYGVTAHYFPCDLTEPEERRRLWQAIDQQHLRFHMLINVAGVDYEGLFDERRLEELRTIIRLNIEATVEMTRSVLNFRQHGRPLRIINVSSLASFYPMPVKAVYAASKRFLLDFSRALRHELGPENITITALCPAGMPTNLACIQGIQAQGMMGEITTLNVGDVASITVQAALAGREVVIPGFVNQVLRVAGSILPAGLTARLIARRWMTLHLKSSLAAAPLTQINNNRDGRSTRSTSIRLLEKEAKP